MAKFPQARPPAAEQENPYLPPGPSALTSEQFNGIRTDASRAGIKDEEMYWCDGFMPIGPQNLRTLYGIGTKIFTTPASTSLVYFDFGNIGSTPYMLAVTSLGGIYAVNTNTSSSNLIAANGTISNPARAAVGLTQYGSKYVLIVAQQTNGYFIWDGTTFYAPGASFSGGTIPTAIGGTAIETYQGRVWIANGPTITYSAPGSVYDFSSADGGGNFTSTDSFLRVSYIQLKQTNGFLYLIGDSSVNYI